MDTEIMAVLQHILSQVVIYFFFAGDSRATAAVRAACKDVGSVSDILFEMRFNPNVFSPGMQTNYTSVL